jgi:uncharacterized protein YPO0396
MVKKVEFPSRSQHVNHHPLQALLNLVAITATCMQRNMLMHANWNTTKVNITEHKNLGWQRNKYRGAYHIQCKSTLVYSENLRCSEFPVTCSSEDNK